MDAQQSTVNRLAFLLRMQVIEYLFRKEWIKFNCAEKSDEELLIVKKLANELPCCTKKFKELFDDVHKMQMERGMVPHAANIGEMEWCLKYRYIGMFQRCKHDWLVYKEDEELRALPAFKQLAEIYKGMLANGQKILPPVNNSKVQSDALAIINEVSSHIKKG